MKPTLAVVILTHNSVELLTPHMKEYLKWVDQIIFVDNYSQDAIQDLADQCQATVLTRALKDDFAQQRNSAFSKIHTDWTFFLDADEYAPPKLWHEIQVAIQSGEFEAFSVPRRDWFLGRFLKYGETGHISLLRLAKTSIGKNTWQRPVHEVWKVNTSRIGRLSSVLEHTPHPTVSAFLNKLHWYASLEASSRKKYSRWQIWGEMIVFPIGKFLYNYVWRQGWRDGKPGCIHALLMSYYSLITRVYLYEAWYT